MVTQLATKNETKINWGGLAIAMASHGLWLAAEDSPRAGGGRADCNVFLLSASFFGTYKCVFVYSMCMRATIVYIYLCDSIVIFECEAHFNMIIVPASVCGGHEVMEGFTWFTVRLSFGRGGEVDGDSPGASESVGQCAVSVQARARCDAVVGGYLMICGQSLQALAFRLARASQAGSVDCGESLEGKRFDTSLTAGGDGVESAISTETWTEKMSYTCVVTAP